MRIALVSYGLSDGGAERVSSVIANGLCELGHEVMLLAVYTAAIEYELNDRIVYANFI